MAVGMPAHIVAIRYDAADAILCCYLAHGMSALPPEGVDWYDVPEYGANLPAAIYRIFGE